MGRQKDNRLFIFSLSSFEIYAPAVLLVFIETFILFLIGRNTLGEGVIALVYLAPISWITAHWGRGPGIVAAIASALAFDFFFIPPFFTFTVGSLEGWLILAIFSLVSAVIVNRIQSGLSQARQREREAILMFELSVAFADNPEPQAIARTLAERLQEIYLADLVQVMIEQKHPHHIFTASFPPEKGATRRPDRLVPILSPHGLLGEIDIWKGSLPLPPVEDPLLQGYAGQVAHTLQRISSNRSDGGDNHKQHNTEVLLADNQ
jgi:K+-sensing histidine kinase KdpD